MKSPECEGHGDSSGEDQLGLKISPPNVKEEINIWLVKTAYDETPFSWKIWNSNKFGSIKCSLLFSVQRQSTLSLSVHYLSRTLLLLILKLTRTHKNTKTEVWNFSSPPSCDTLTTTELLIFSIVLPFNRMCYSWNYILCDPLKYNTFT